MNDCPTCGYPMVWSEDHSAMRCSVYGVHVDEPCQCHTCQTQRERWQRHSAAWTAARRLKAVS